MIKKRLSTLSLMEEIIRHLNKHNIQEATLSIQDKVISITWGGTKGEEYLESKPSQQVSKNDQELLEMFRSPPSLGKIKEGLSRTEIWEDIIGRRYEDIDRL